MKEIKFRGRCIITGIWAYGYYYTSKGNAIIRDNKDNECIVDPKTVGQYISLKDKNKKEIFEGDYQIDLDMLFLIVFEGSAFRYDVYKLQDNDYWKFLDYANIESYWYDKRDFSKNIYENPVSFK